MKDRGGEKSVTAARSSIGSRMVSSYPLPEGFSDFDVFSLGSCLLVEGECSCFSLMGMSQRQSAGAAAAVTPYPGHLRQCRGGKHPQLPNRKHPTLRIRGMKPSSRRAPAHFHSQMSFSLSPSRSAGILSERGDSRRFLQSAGAEDPQQFPGVQLSLG